MVLTVSYIFETWIAVHSFNGCKYPRHRNEIIMSYKQSGSYRANVLRQQCKSNSIVNVKWHHCRHILSETQLYGANLFGVDSFVLPHTIFISDEKCKHKATTGLWVFTSFGVIGWCGSAVATAAANSVRDVWRTLLRNTTVTLLSQWIYVNTCSGNKLHHLFEIMTYGVA